MQRQHSRNVEKRARIGKNTLVVGIDVGSQFNAVALMDREGKVLKVCPKVYNSRKGFDYFTKVIGDHTRRHGFRDIIVGMEPTGHYWRKIAFFAMDQGMEVRFVRTTALKHQRELDESSSGKSDVKDALTIANLVREGKYLDTVIEDGIFRQLRTLGKLRERIQRTYSGTKHALGAVVDDYFPELKGIFWSMDSKGLWALLERFPFPEDVLAQEGEVLEALIRQATRNRCNVQEKVQRIFEAAELSVGLKRPGLAERMRVALYMEQLRQLEAHRKKIDHEMRQLVFQVPYAEILLSIPGIGALSMAAFLGELGDPKYFPSYRSMVKFAGLDPVERDSGLRTGGRRISKKGRFLLRKFIYFMSLRVVHHNAYFRHYYQQRLRTPNRFGQPLVKKEALCAVSIKLIKVMFALLRDQRRFTEKPPAVLKQAA